MRYLCLVYSVEDPANALSESEEQALTNENLEYDEHLRKRGHLVVAHALQTPETAVIVHVRNGRVSVTDGPFTETKEQIAGFLLIEAQDLNDAIQVAAMDPTARYGFIEVRPVQELVKSGERENQ
jgi:hypothetical protein